ncbi:MAG: ABC transporter ATP-binding protein [Sphingomonadales bacterium]|nr:ABC transporter ATP-binding protein [Sphingomonadales bacterium]MDE2167841.1 ABC transporter ATP-binding protein [Sphingomonadales bacterium]
MTGAPLAEARKVVKRFGAVTALAGVDLVLHGGQMTGLVGPDGAGKTTLIRILAGLVDADEGSAQVLGASATQMRRQSLGYMPQRFGLYEDLSVLENLTLYAELRALPDAERSATFARLLDFTDLARFQSRLAGQLSGGMKQKLGLACALVSQPQVLLLDEPGVGVDPVSRHELWDMVRAMAGEGVGVLWSTAYLDEAERCDQVYLLSEGALVHAGPPGEMMARVAGRVVQVAVPASERRERLHALRASGVVMDAVRHGEALRLLLRQPVDQVDPALGLSNADIIAPRFEDGFIDALGGADLAESALAAQYRTIPENDAPAIEAKGLTKRYGAFTAAGDISFSVPRGTIFGLLGPNGAGKSTTFRMLCGLITASAGTGSVAGHDLRRARADARQSLGYMAQKFSLYGDLSVRQNLAFFAGIYGLSGHAAREAIAHVTQVFHLSAMLDMNAGTLPLGFRQRLSLACAVMHQPPVLFLDEPTSGVDPLVRREFWNHITALVDKGVTVLVTTHFMDEAEYCDRIALVHQSRLIASGTPDELRTLAGAGQGPVATMDQAFAALIRAADTAREKAA